MCDSSSLSQATILNNTAASPQIFSLKTDDILELFLPDQGQPPVKQHPEAQETPYIDNQCEMETDDIRSMLSALF